MDDVVLDKNKSGEFLNEHQGVIDYKKQHMSNKNKRRNKKRKIKQKYNHFNLRLNERYSIDISFDEYCFLVQAINDNKIKMLKKYFSNGKYNYIYEANIKNKKVQIFSTENKGVLYVNTCFKPVNYLEIKKEFWKNMIKSYFESVINTFSYRFC